MPLEHKVSHKNKKNEINISIRISNVLNVKVFK